MMRTKLSIALLGATSHIAKNLIVRFGADVELFLFCRNEARMNEFLAQEKPVATCHSLGYDVFQTGKYDVVINCVGVGDPRKQKIDPYESFVVTERFDNLALDYAKKHPAVRYINFSSGAVFGADFDSPVDENSLAVFKPNDLQVSDAYRIAKLNAEAKHRCLSYLQLVDIRVFSFFSRFIDLDAGFLMSEIARCVIGKTPLRTNSVDIVRDYISPDDLFNLVFCIIENSSVLNLAIDARSKMPVKKTELIQTISDVYGLEVEIQNVRFDTVSGAKNEYYSKNNKAFDLIGTIPEYTSLECV
ncbi:MAG: NAD-dependent epimerase/dehydratase family protein, partial [Clostridia bacterium]